MVFVCFGEDFTWDIKIDNHAQMYLWHEAVCITVKWTWYNGRDIFSISRPGGLPREKV